MGRGKGEGKKKGWWARVVGFGEGLTLYDQGGGL